MNFRVGAILVVGAAGLAAVFLLARPGSKAPLPATASTDATGTKSAPPTLVGRSAAGSSTRAEASSEVWDVEALMKGSGEAPSRLRVRGVVSRVDSKKKSFGLIDAAEFRSCGVTTCASLTLPVRWGGGSPAVEDFVEVEGRIEKDKGRQYLVAVSLKTLPPEKPAKS